MNMNVCPYCGSEIHAGDQKCISCGKIIPNVQFSLNDLQGNSDFQKSKSKFKWIILGGIVIFLIFFLILYFILI